MNWGILSLLGFIGLVLGGVAGFGIFLMRRAASHAEPELQLSETDAAQYFEPDLGRTTMPRVGQTAFARRRQKCRPTISHPEPVELER
jgi:hypothetical protein